jgi:hypothetical protein
MSTTKYLIAKLAIVLCGVLPGYNAYAQPSVAVGVVVPSVEIRVESDFYEPLAPQGEWVVVGSYGRCWRPAHVEVDWRPYCNGSWEMTDAGWYWVSDEPWAWATYHYGRWDYTAQYGWYWVPQIQWAPAWVSWHEGGGYIGWAPLQPSVSISVSGYVGFNAALIPPRAFIFVRQGQFLDPIRPTMVVVNNTTIINKTTVNITKTKIVNNVVINDGPATAFIEKASGRKVQAVAVRELRRKEEAVVVARQRTSEAAIEKKSRTPIRDEATPVEKKIIPPHESPQVEKPSALPHGPEAQMPKNREAQSEKHQSAPVQPELKPNARPENNHAPANRESTRPKAGKNAEQPQNPPAGEKGEANPADDSHDKKSKE